MNKKNLRKIGFLLIFFVVLLAVYVKFYRHIAEPHLNVILITIETLRADHLSIYGYDKETSPNIDDFAKEGIIFANAVSAAPSTCPSIASIMTSKYPSFHGMLLNPYYFPQENITLAEILKKNGYQTAAFVGNFTLRKAKRLNKGFDIYDDTYPEEEKVRHLPERIASSLNEAAMDWLSQNYKKEFFLWLHYQDPHGPYTPPSLYDKKFDRSLYRVNKKVNLLAEDDNSGFGGIPWYQQLDGDGKKDARYYISQYDGEIAYLDYYLGQFFDFIKKLEIEEKTLIILTADHGEAMDNDHGYYFSHENGLTEDQIRVPLIIKFPGCEKSKIIKYQVSTINIMPTVLDLTGISISHKIQGKNLFKKRKKYAFSENHLGKKEVSVRTNKYKLIAKESGKFFYNLSNDQKELKNLYSEKTKIVKVLEKKLNRHIHQSKKYGHKSITLVPTEEEKRRLKSLGYIN